MKKELIDLGTFEVVSGVLRLSDPCYDKKTWCAGSVDNVLNGTWKSQVVKKTEDNWGHRCRKLIAVHESFTKETCTFKKLKIDVGVDSGQAGIFDDKFYQVNYDEDCRLVGNLEYEHNMYNNHRQRLDKDMYKMLAENAQTEASRQQYLKIVKEIEAGPPKIDYSKAELTKDWYEVCSDKSLSNIGAGVIRGGVVSSSGYGDGSYTAYAAYNQDNQVVGIKILF